MYLQKVVVKNFRSIFSSEEEKELEVDLDRGMNIFTGPNSVGKSNFLKALALAFEGQGGIGFRSEHDLPKSMTFAFPQITLSFKVSEKISGEKTLLKYAKLYEQSCGAKSFFADQKLVRFRVKFNTRGERIEMIVSRAQKSGDKDLHSKTLEQLKKMVRFVYLQSGESLNDFFADTLREILHTVIIENEKGLISEINSLQEEYKKKIEEGILEPLSKHVEGYLQQQVQGIKEVMIVPRLSSLDEIIASSQIEISDQFPVGIEEKGTGVRGMVLASLLSYLAKSSRRSLVLAIEEPESFLHPAAQSKLGGALAELALSNDKVSLLITTHSPFLISGRKEGKIVEFSRDSSGRTYIEKQLQGTEFEQTALLERLIENRILAKALGTASEVSNEDRALVIFEGATDIAYLNASLRVCNRESILKNVCLLKGDGAEGAALKALVLRGQLGQEFPIVVILDHDEIGRETKRTLISKFKWDKHMVFTYERWCDEKKNQRQEAEHMFSAEFIEKFLRRSCGTNILRFTEASRTVGEQTFYDLNKEGKEHLVRYVQREMSSSDAHCWLKMVEDLSEVILKRSVGQRV